jgi:23S rRNA pseudouridine1911/1915/1917 synthase
MDDSPYVFTVSTDESGLRLDKFLAQKAPDLSRARIQALVEDDAVSCGEKTVTSCSSKVKIGETYQILVPEPEPSHIEPQAMALDIYFEDEHILVLNKPAGLTVHPAPGNRDGTLVNALLAHCGDSLSGIGGVARPGIVHRLDKDTSGLMVVAKHDAAHHHLSDQLSTRTLKRTYNAVAWGHPAPANGTITGAIGRSPANRQKMAIVTKGGKEATTHYRTLRTFDIASLVECSLETGRTHQIRVHMLKIGHPLIGDPLYGTGTSTRLKQNIYKKLEDSTRATLLGFTRQALHAKALGLIHPHTQEAMHFECPLPDDMEQLLKALAE